MALASRVMLILALIVGCLAAPAVEGVSAGVPISVQGQVKDLSGNPIPGLWVHDEISWAGARTAADGSYALQAYVVGCGLIANCTTGEVRIRAGGNGYQNQTKKVFVLDNTQQINFQLQYSLHAFVSPRTSVSVPASLTINAWTRAPVADSCVVFLDLRSGKTIALTPTDTIDPYNQTRKWTNSTDLQLDADASPGKYRFEVSVTNCQTGTPLSPTKTGAYFFDEEQPQITIVSPKEGTQYVADQEAGPSYDGLTHVSGMQTFRATVSDDVGLETAWISIYVQYGSYDHWLGGCTHELVGQVEAEISCTFFFILDEPNRQYFVEVGLRDESGKYSHSERIFYQTPV